MSVALMFPSLVQDCVSQFLDGRRRRRQKVTPFEEHFTKGVSEILFGGQVEQQVSVQGQIFPLLRDPHR